MSRSRESKRPFPLLNRGRWLVPVGLVLVLPWTFVVEASPPGDDWTLETKKDDEKLIEQRFAKLRSNPFDDKQWRALEKALTRGGLVRRIGSAAKASPNNVALQILQAKAEMLEGDPRTAADRLAKLQGKSSKWDARVFDTWINALEQAKAWTEALDALEARAKTDAKQADRHLERAYKLADRAGIYERALALADTIAAKHPKDPSALVRVARAARAAGKPERADEAYVKAISKAKGDSKNELIAERARARVDASKYAEAATILWELLDDPNRGRTDQREGWWSDLESCYRKQARSEVLVEELEKWLGNTKHAKEVSAWQALAHAQKAAGLDPIPALQTAIDLAPKDPIARAALIEALEEQGHSEAALEQYRQLKGRSAEEVRLGLEMAERLIINGERDTGLEIADQIRQNGARDRDTLLLLIEFYNNIDERSIALDTARALVGVAKRSADARVALGEQLWEMGQRKEALEQWEQLPKLVRPSHQGWYRHAEILADHANMDRALRDTALESLAKATKSKPNEPTYLRLQAMLEEDRNRPDLALVIWEKIRVVAQEPAQALLRDEARTRIVELLAGPGLPNRQEKRTEAVADAEAALARGASPEALEAGLFLAELYRREDNLEGAVAMYTKLRELFPNDPDRLMEQAVAQRRANRPEDALLTLVQVLPLAPANEADVLHMIMELSFGLEKFEEAREAAVQALAGGSTGIRTMLRHGELNERETKTDQALWSYERVLEAYPDHARTRMRLAELQLDAGKTEAAAKSFRDLLDGGGPSDLMREAGTRALDLAEVTDSTGEVLDLAVKRTKREPNADEPRDFLLATLDRVDLEQVELWLRQGGKQRDSNRVAAMRRPLVSALARGSVNKRMSAAVHLGALALPDTAAHLARTGANLQPPRDATHALRQRFIAARVAATRAAGELDDPAAIPVMADMVADRGVDSPVRAAAFWALARSSSENAAAPLRSRIRGHDDEVAITLSCLGLARLSRDSQRVEDLVIIDRLARESSRSSVRRACAFAAVALTPDYRVARLHPQLLDADPFVAAIAAWRMGQVDPAKVQPETVEALFGVLFGPGGLARDAAVASLANLLSPDRAAAGITTPPVPRERDWNTVVERWLVAHIAPSLAPLDDAELILPHREQLLAAWRTSMAGTRAELHAARGAARPCGSPPSDDTSANEQPTQMCLEPLLLGTIEL